MTMNNISERNYRDKCLGSPVTSYGGGNLLTFWKLQVKANFVFHQYIFSSVFGQKALKKHVCILHVFDKLQLKVRAFLKHDLKMKVTIQKSLSEKSISK